MSTNITSQGILNGTIPNALIPLYPQAIIFPIVAFPSWILCILPLVWHFRQGNVAAGSLILWTVMSNFFNSINPLIWPRDNLSEWWSGVVWCDIHARIQVGAIVGMTASTVMIIRRLAKVMDTSNITVSTSDSSKQREKMIEFAWCWLYPLVLIILYYIVQPARYMIFGIVGCVSAYDTSWLSIVLSFMWAPINVIVAACYAGLLSYRLYRYRLDFRRLVAARNTTQSRFIRLFIICILVIVLYVPYTIYLLASLSQEVVDSYDWARVHNPEMFNSIMKVPAMGQVSISKWGSLATGYLLFLVFGTGADAYETYKKTLLALGLGRLFSCLHNCRKDGHSANSSFIGMRTWKSSVSNKAKSVLWSRNDSVTNSSDVVVRNNSIVSNSMPPLHTVCTEEQMLKPRAPAPVKQPSFLSRIFARRQGHGSILPLFSRHNIKEIEIVKHESTRSMSPSVSAHAWAASSSSRKSLDTIHAVHVVHEVHQDHQEQGRAIKQWN